jgi:hypothetical protein
MMEEPGIIQMNVDRYREMLSLFWTMTLVPASNNCSAKPCASLHWRLV